MKTKQQKQSWQQRGLLAWLVSAAALIACVMLNGCGFQPVYGFSDQRDDAAESLLAQVRVDVIADRIGQQLRNGLLDRMNPRGVPQTPQYQLAVSVTESRSDLGIERDDTATFAKQTILANFELKQINDGAVLLSAAARSTNSYNILRSSPYATLKAEDDARRRAALEIADDITNRVALFLKTHKAEQKEAQQQKNSYENPGF